MSRVWPVNAYFLLEHLLNVIIFCLKQLSPRRQIAEGQHSSWFKETVGVVFDKQELMSVPCFL